MSVATSNDKDYPILYEIYFPAPSQLSKFERLRHYLTTRNVLALLSDKTLVGLTYYQALADLLERMDFYMPPNSDNAGYMIDWLVRNNLDDVRNDLSAAAGLLAWCEGVGVRWEEGYVEGFVHCTGMYGSRTVGVPETRDITPISRVLIERANRDVASVEHSVSTSQVGL